MCPDDVAQLWPAADNPPLLAWNPNIGLGFVGAADARDGHKAYVWLWRSARYKKAIFHLQYWRGVKFCSEAAVHAVEMLAFGNAARHGFWLLETI